MDAYFRLVKISKDEVKACFLFIYRDIADLIVAVNYLPGYIIK